jgi:hypothetical protein
VAILINGVQLGGQVLVVALGVDEGGIKNILDWILPGARRVDLPDWS